MTTPDLPPHHNRTIESLRPVPGGVEILCDCATLTEVVFDFEEGAPTDGQEIALTCDGCTTVHWFTFHATTTEAGQQ